MGTTNDRIVRTIVNRPARRVDAVEKVTGRARFAADLFFDGMLHARVLRARFPHARILSIDTREAERVPGVVAVVTHADIPGARAFGPVRQDMPVFAFEKTRYLGDGVAMVVAATPVAAERALSQIRVEYQELPAVFSPEDALAKGAPVLHEGFPDNIV